MTNTTHIEHLKAAKKITTVIYALYAASFFVGITALVAIIINYVKRSDVSGTFLETHFRWQIRTFWYGLLWGVFGIVLSFVGVGLIVLIIDGIWMLYRIIKGWFALHDEKPMYVEK